MGDDPELGRVRDSLGDVRVEFSTLSSEVRNLRLTVDNHSERLRLLELDVSNNKLILRAATFITGSLGASALAVAGTLLKTVLEL